MKKHHRIPALLGASLAAPLLALALAISVTTIPTTTRAFELADGLELPVSYTGEGFGNVHGGYRRGAAYKGLLNIGLDADLGKLANLPGLTLHAAVLDIHGPGISGHYVHDFNGVSNIDAYDSVRLYDVWLQHESFDGRLSVRVGQLLADEEFFVSENGALFLNGAFGAIPLVSLNTCAPLYPVAAPGVRVAWKFSERWSLQAGVFDGDVGEPDSTNKHGVDWRLNRSEGLLALAEVAYNGGGLTGHTCGKADGKTLPAPAHENGNAIDQLIHAVSTASPVSSCQERPKTGLDRVLCGTYKLGAFYRKADENVSSTDRAHTGNGGVYFIADQPLWKSGTGDGESLNAFLRLGGASAERNTVPFYFDTGLVCTGLLPGRGEDQLGLGLSYTRLSHYVRRPGDDFNANHEATLELTYKIKVNKWCDLQPDAQYVFRPGGTKDYGDAFVLGLRCVLSF